MNPLLDQQTVASEMNGPITVRNLFGRKKIIAHGYEQGSRYLADLWKKATDRVPDEHSVKHILVLGLGGGSSIRHLHARWPDAHMTVVEWDPTMVEIAKSLKAFPRKWMPEIIVEDAVTALAKMTRTFDVILIDLYTGGVPEPRLASDEMIASLARVLERDGYLLLNLFKTLTLIPAFERHLSRDAAWYYKHNALASFRHPGQGRVGDPVPKGFVHQMQSPAYLTGGWEANSTNNQLVGKEGTWGMRWHYGPFWIEACTSDIMPTIDPTGPSRLVIWQPITKLSRPAGWHRSWIQMNAQQHGFGDVAGKPEYWKEWTAHAQRHRKKWLKDARYEIAEVSLKEFADAYHKTGKLPMMRKDFIRLLERRMVRHGSDVHLFAARDKETKEIISGLAVCDLPDVSVSMHLIAYINPKFEKTSVGTGLIDHWYAHCLKTGIRFPHFGLVWTHGDPNGWKGYSKFKRQFNIHLLLYPNPLIRFVKRRKTAA